MRTVESQVDWDKLYQGVDPHDNKQHWHYPRVSTPRQLVLWKKFTDQLIRENPEQLGDPVPTDVFVWSIRGGPSSAPRTQLGGRPWREADRPWPTTGLNMRPLQFIAQFSFVDSKEIFDFELPGDVLCIYGLTRGPGIDTNNCPVVLEWNPAQLHSRARFCPSGCELHQAYFGHRTRVTQYPEARICVGGENDIPLQIQGTLIGEHIAWPQGDAPGDGGKLICALSSTQLLGEWPLVDCERLPEAATYKPMTTPIMIGDMGILSIIRDRKGRFCVDEECY